MRINVEVKLFESIYQNNSYQFSSLKHTLQQSFNKSKLVKMSSAIYLERKVLTLQIYTKYFMTSAGMLFVLYFYAFCSLCLTVLISNFILETECKTLVLNGLRQIEGLALVPMFQKYISSCSWGSWTTSFRLTKLNAHESNSSSLPCCSHTDDHMSHLDLYVSRYASIGTPHRKMCVLKLMTTAQDYPYCQYQAS